MLILNVWKFSLHLSCVHKLKKESKLTSSVSNNIFLGTHSWCACLNFCENRERQLKRAQKTKCIGQLPELQCYWSMPLWFTSTLPYCNVTAAEILPIPSPFYPSSWSTNSDLIKLAMCPATTHFPATQCLGVANRWEHKLNGVSKTYWKIYFSPYSSLNERMVAEILAAILDHEVILKTEVTKDGGA